MNLYVPGLLFLVWALCLLPIPGLKYSDRWVIQINSRTSAGNVADRHGMRNLGRVMDGYDYYTFQQSGRRESPDPRAELEEDREVLWFEHEAVLPVVSRGGGGGGGRVSSISAGTRDGLKLNDSMWTDGMQWYLDKSSSSSLPTMNVRTAWENCVRGDGVTVAVVDDGIFHENQDLQNRINLEASYDVYRNQSDPKPEVADYDHGTKVAGVLGADTNGFCGVGAAFNVSIAGIRLFGGEVTDDRIATALTKTGDKIDIYVNSWGPVMDGTELGSVGKLTEIALEKMATEGRQKRGSIFIWAGGNGGKDDMDSCAYDGYVNNRYTIPINGVTRWGSRLNNGERCSAIMATAYSKDKGSKDPIVTTTGIDGCTNDFGDSSAAAAFGGGIIALALQANPELTWRDVQHLITLTSKSNVNFKPNDWKMNARKYNVSPTFGFGLLDAGKLVQYAKDWKTVPAAVKCELSEKLPNMTPVYIHKLEASKVGCKGVEINYLEHVQVHVNLTYAARGYVAAKLTSPSGTESEIIPGRIKDTKARQLDWLVTSVHFWGEPAAGKWKIQFYNKFKDHQVNGTLISWKLILHGTVENPREGQNTSYTIVNGAEPPCPVLAPFERISGETDYTPLYIFIALVVIIAVSIITYFVYKRKLKNDEKCQSCGPRYKPTKTVENQIA